jgi:hypothetical protein
MEEEEEDVGEPLERVDNRSDPFFDIPDGPPVHKVQFGPASTPFTQAADGEAPLDVDPEAKNAVDRIAFAILKKSVVDDSETGPLVVVDDDEPARIAPTVVGPGAHVKLHRPDARWTVHGRRPRQSPAIIRKPDHAIIMPDHREWSHELHQVISEGTPFPKVRYDAGRTIRVRGARQTVQPVAHQTRVPRPATPESEARTQSQLQQESPVVSFTGGGRGITGGRGGFTAVRIHNGRLRTPLQRSFVPLELRPSVTQRPLFVASQQRESAGVRRGIERLVREILPGLGPMEYERLRRRARAIEPVGGVPPRGQSIRQKIETILEEIALAGERADPHSAADRLLDMVRENPANASVLVAVLDAMQDIAPVPTGVIPVHPPIRICSSEPDWVGDAVAVQYNTASLELDARIAPVRDVAKRRPPKGESQPRKTPMFPVESDTTLDDFEIGELMQILPYILTESEIDMVLR